MSKLKYLIFLCLIVLFQHTDAGAQRVLSLDDALFLAKKNNSELILARLDRLKAEKKVSEVYSENLLPTLTLSSNYIRSFRKQVIQIFGQTFEIGSDNSITSSFDASEPIPVLGTPVFSGIRIAEYYSKLQEENVTQIENKISSSVKKSFYNVLLLKEVVELNKSSIANAEENLRVVDARYKAGVALEFDYLRAKVNLETFKPELTKSINNLEISKKILKNNIGLKEDEDIDVKGGLVFDTSEVRGPINDIIRNISEKNVAVRQLIITKLINDELIRVDKAGYLPKLFLFGQYSIQAYENDDRDFFKYRYFNVITAGIGLSWDLNVFRNNYKVAQSEIESKKTEELIRDVKEKLKLASESIILRIEDAKERIRIQGELVDQAQRGLELATVSFKSGVLNQIDVLGAELVLNQVKLAYLQAVHEYLMARTELEELMEKF